MNSIQVTARFTIYEGKLDDFKALAAACIKSVREKDTGTLQYDWFFNDDQTECVVREHYKDSEAVLEHIGNLGDTFGALLAVSDIALEIYGTPSPALLKASEGLELVSYGYFDGL